MFDGFALDYLQALTLRQLTDEVSRACGATVGELLADLFVWLPEALGLARGSVDGE